MSARIRGVKFSGVSDLSAPVQAQLKPGYNPFYHAAATHKVGVAALLSSIGDSKTVAQVASTALAADGVLRVDWQNDGKVMTIQRKPSQSIVQAKVTSGTETLAVAKDDEAMLEAWVEHLGLCMPDDWRNLYVWMRDVRHFQKQVAAPAMDPLPEDETQIKKQLQALQEERMMLGSMGNVQDQADQMQSRLFEIEHRLREIEKLLAERQEISDHIETRQELMDGGKVLAEKARAYENNRTKFEQTEYKHTDKRTQLEQKIAHLRAQPTWLGDKRMWIALVLFLAGPIAAGITKIQWLAVPSFLAVGFLGYLVFQYVKSGGELSELEDKLSDEVKKFKHAQKEYLEYSNLIDRLTKEYKLITQEDLAKEYDRVKLRVEELEQWDTANDFAALDGEQKELTQEQGELTEKYEKLSDVLREAAGAGNSARELGEKIARLEAALKGETLAVDAAEAPPVLAGPLDDWATVLQTAVKIGGFGDWSMVSGQIERTMEEFLPHFLGGKWVRTTVGDSGIELYDNDHKNVLVGDLDDNSQTVIAALFRVGLWLALPQQRQYPVIIEGVLDDLDDDQAKNMAKVLGKLAGSTQVIHFSSKRVFAPQGRAIELAADSSAL